MACTWHVVHHYRRTCQWIPPFATAQTSTCRWQYRYCQQEAGRSEKIHLALGWPFRVLYCPTLCCRAVVIHRYHAHVPKRGWHRAQPFPNGLSHSPLRSNPRMVRFQALESVRTIVASTPQTSHSGCLVTHYNLTRIQRYTLYVYILNIEHIMQPGIGSHGYIIIEFMDDDGKG